jgi:hypothetical protein
MAVPYRMTISASRASKAALHSKVNYILGFEDQAAFDLTHPAPVIRRRRNCEKSVKSLFEMNSKQTALNQYCKSMVYKIRCNEGSINRLPVLNEKICFAN